MLALFKKKLSPKNSGTRTLSTTMDVCYLTLHSWENISTFIPVEDTY